MVDIAYYNRYPLKNQGFYFYRCETWEADILPLNYTCNLNQLLHYTINEIALQVKNMRKEQEQGKD